MEGGRCTAAVFVLCLFGAVVMSYPFDEGQKLTEALHTPLCNITARLTKVLSDGTSTILCNGTTAVDYDCSPDIDSRVVNATRNMVKKLHTTGNKARVQCDFNYGDMPFGTCSVRMEVKKSEAKDGNSNGECLLSTAIVAVACDSESEISLIQRSVGHVKTEKCSRYDN